MKRTLLFTTLSLVLVTPGAFAKTELEILRAKCKEQEAQIRLLENENSKLGGNHETLPKAAAVETAQAAPKAAETAPSTASSTYTVKAGDSFAKIARKTGTTPEKLAKSNGLKLNSFIRVGQELKVPGSTAAASTSVAATKTTSAPAPVAALAGKTHTVRQGETYSTISRKYKIPTSTLVAANPKVKATAMRPGQVIQLGQAAPAVASAPAPVAKSPAPMPSPASALAPAPAPVAKAPAPRSSTMNQTMPVSTAMPKHSPAPAKMETAPAPAPAPAIAETPAHQESSAPSPEKKIQPVVIEGEMTYGEFAAKHGTDAERLNALNGLDLTTATVLAKGSELYVPAQP